MGGRTLHISRPLILLGTRRTNLVKFSRNLQQMFHWVSCHDYNCFSACTCIHAHTAHIIVHAPFPPFNLSLESTILKKMVVTSLKCVDLVQYFFRKSVFFNFHNFLNCCLKFFRWPGGCFENKCSGHEPQTI